MILVGILLVIGLGLASRKYPSLFPAMFGKYPGDVLWALMVYLGWCFLKPTDRPLRIGIDALITSTLIELSQLIQTPQLNAIRHTTLGHLILGTVFSWADLLAYGIGIGLGLILDSLQTQFGQKRI